MRQAALEHAEEMEELRQESDRLLKSLEDTIRKKEKEVESMRVEYQEMNDRLSKKEAELAIALRRGAMLKRSGGFVLLQLTKAQLRYVTLVGLAKKKFHLDAERRVDKVRVLVLFLKAL